MDCIFCRYPEKPVYENTFVYVIYDNYPVTKGHALIIPKRHIQDYFSTNIPERQAIDAAIHYLKKHLDDTYHPDGYNIGINNGKAAGQTVFHLHVHVIPRYKDDCDYPEGGVRGVIPGKQKYS